MSNRNQATLSPITQGIYKSYTMTIYDKNNNSVDLLNKTIYFTIKRDIDDSDDDALFQKITLVNTAGNVFVLNITTLESLDLENGVFPYDIKISFAGSPKEIQFGFGGTISIIQTVTKDALR